MIFIRSPILFAHARIARFAVYTDHGLFQQLRQYLKQLWNIQRFGNMAVHAGTQCVFPIILERIGSHGHNGERCLFCIRKRTDPAGRFI